MASVLVVEVISIVILLYILNCFSTMHNLNHVK